MSTPNLEDITHDIKSMRSDLSTIRRMQSEILSKVSDKDKMLTGPEAAEYLCYSYSYFINFIKPQIPHERHGRKIMVSRMALDAWKKTYAPDSEPETVAEAATAI